MDKQAADDFLCWLSANSSSIVAVCSEMQSPAVHALAPKQRAAKLQKLFLKIEKEVGPRLSRVEDGLQFEVGPGKEKRHALVISAGGVSALIEAVRYLAEHSPSLDELEIVAFKPARQIAETAKQIVETSSGRKEVTPTEVFYSLTPELTKIGITLYFKDYQEEDDQAWGQVGFNLMDFALGEYQVMESVGAIAFQALSEATNATHSITELAQDFETQKAQLIEQYNELARQSAESRFAASLKGLSSSIKNLNEAIGQDDCDDVMINVSIWSRSPEITNRLKDNLPEIEVEGTPGISAVGNGILIAISGSVPKANFTPEGWLRYAILPALSSDGVITGISEKELPGPRMALLVGLSLLKQEKYDEVIKILKFVASRHRKTDDGSLHGLLAMAYLKAQRYEEANRTYEIAGTLVTDANVRGEIFTNRGSALQSLGRLDEALRSFEEGLELGPSKYARQYNVGQAYAQTGNIKKACLHLGKALELNPDLLDHIKNDKDLAPIRSSSEYLQLITKYENHSKGMGSLLKRLLGKKTS